MPETLQEISQRPPWEIGKKADTLSVSDSQPPWKVQGSAVSGPSGLSSPTEPEIAEPAPSFLEEAGSVAKAVPAGLGGAFEAFGRAGRVLGVPGSERLIEAAKVVGGKFREPLEGTIGESLRGGVESTVTSLIGALPGAAVGGAVGSAVGGPPGTVIGAVAGFAGGAGVVFSLAEYDQFMDDLAEHGRAQGLEDSQIAELQNSMKDRAIVSALAEGGLEAAGNLIQAKVLGFLGGKAVKETAATGIKGFLGRWLLNTAKIAPAELATELATTAVQVEERRAAGLPQPELGEALGATAGTTLVQSVLTSGLGTGLQRSKLGGKSPQLEEIVAQPVEEPLGSKNFDPEEIIQREYKDRVAWAKTQIDENEWIGYFEEVRDSDLARARGETVEGSAVQPSISPNPGQEINRQLSDEPPVESADRLEDTYTGKEREQPFTLLNFLKDLGSKVLTPEFYQTITSAEKVSGAVKQIQEGPMRTTSEVINADLLFHHIVNDHAAHYKSLMKGLSEKERKLTTKIMDLVFSLRDDEAPIVSQRATKDELQRILAEHPKLSQVLRGTDKRGGIIEFFEKIKERVKASKRRTFILTLTPTEFDMFNKAASIQGAVTDDALTEIVNSNLNLEALAQAKAQKEGVNWEKLSTDRQAKRIENTRKSELRKLKKTVQEYKAIDKWGIKDYYTHIELGSWVVLDQEGNALAFERTRNRADKRARELRQEALQNGESLPPLEVVASINRIDPTKERKDVGLRGQEDIFEALPRYVYAMEKRIVFDPVIAKYKKDRAQNPHLYDARSIRVIEKQIEAAKGGKPIWADKLADGISVAFGWETGKGSRNLARMRAYTANLKLGYRPVAMAVNAMGGFGNTWTALGSNFFVKGAQVLRSGQYTGADGKLINMERKLREIENQGLLGVDFAVGEDGTVSSRTAIWKPLGLFQLPEKTIRRHSFAANYLYQREALGKSDFEATENAIVNLRFQQNAYNLVAIPEIFRRPDTKTLFQFKTYMVRQSEFISTLRGKQLARMFGVMLAMGGARGLLYTLVSLPILGATGALDKLEEWFVKEKGLTLDALSKGLPGLLGTDITAAAAFRYPHTPEDWAGPVLGELIKLKRDVIFPALEKAGRAVGGADEASRPQFVLDDGIDWLGNLPLIAGYWNDFLKSIDVNVAAGSQYKWGVSVDFGEGSLLKRLQAPNMWIHDSNGDRAFKVDGLRDRLLLLAGASPADRSEYSVLRRQWSRDTELRRQNRSKTLDRAIGTWQKTGSLPSDMQDDLTLYGVNPQALLSRATRSVQTPRQREVLKTELLRRAEALDKFGLD